MNIKRIVTNAGLFAAAAVIGSVLDPSLSFAGGAEIVRGIQWAGDTASTSTGVMIALGAAGLGIPMIITGNTHGLMGGAASRLGGAGVTAGGVGLGGYMGFGGGGAGLDLASIPGLI